MTQAKYYDSASGTWKAIIAGPAGPAGPSGIVSSPTAPVDTTVLWLDTVSTASTVALQDLSNATITSVSNNDLLKYDGPTSRWVNSNTISVTGATLAGTTSLTGTTTATGLITANGGVSGALTGNVTGNASTATKLATPRAINGVDFDGSAPITVTAAAGTLSGTTLASGVTASSLTSVGTLTALGVTGLTTATGGVTTGAASTVTLGAGTDTVSPLKLGSGTNLTTATNASSGAVEYDGKVFYGTPGATSGRGVLSTSYYYSLGSAATGANGTAIQSMIPGTTGITVQAGTLYEFEVVGAYTLGNATSKTVTWTVGGPASGGATFHSYAHTAQYQTSSAIGSPGASNTVYLTAASLAFTTVTATTNQFMWKGQFRVNATGKFMPMITFSVAPTSYTVSAGSYVKVTPIATAANGTANLSVGAW